jgi:hypothetical protein
MTQPVRRMMPRVSRQVRSVGAWPACTQAGRQHGCGAGQAVRIASHAALPQLRAYPLHSPQEKS